MRELRGIVKRLKRKGLRAEFCRREEIRERKKVEYIVDVIQ